ncbi:MAG: alpha amylase N-terminal ig-like domain-containing protein [Armatimonadota bacterium]|nr:alpha amylase N-terminal ig-like domain-containing protein [bacterium]MDW8321322.1 alpha amylase N-terminal ig-like domain-containing protein [Armatimonadota bacterium]
MCRARENPSSLLSPVRRGGRIFLPYRKRERGAERFIGFLLVLCWLLFASATPAQDGVPVTFRLQLDEPAQVVYLAGTFNDWQVGRNPMHSEDGGRTWTLTLHLMPGVYQYKFVVNGTEWRTDPNAVQNVDDGMGNINSLLVVEARGLNPPARAGDGLITLSALRHEPRDMLYLQADGQKAVLTLRTRRDDVQRVEVTLYDGKRFIKKPVPRVAQDTLFAYYRLSVARRPVQYLFMVRDGNKQVWLSPQGATDARPAQWFRLHPEQLPDVRVPAWVADAIFYQIVPDRFLNADRANDPDANKPLDETGRTDQFFGGDLWGVVQKAGYLNQLGVTALYLTPIFTSVTHHKYDTDDYTHVDPHFGGDEALITLCRELKRRGMRLILDGVFNHVGVHFFAFRDLLEKQEKSAYRNWFTVHRFPVKIENPAPYSAWWGIPYVPKLNHENPEVSDYLLNKVILPWMRRVPFDGWRLDVANEVPDHFWREFRKQVKRVRPDAVIIGEIWGDATHWLRGDMFDAVMNYPWRGFVLDWVAFRRTTPSVLDDRLRLLAMTYPRAVTYSMYNMLSSHDTHRLRTLCGGDWRKVRLAFLLQMTLPGAPAIYYGDEVGMEGGNIPDNRRPMDWIPPAEGEALRRYVASLVHLRRQHVALRRGDWVTLLTDDSRNVYVYLRQHGKQQVLVAINNGEKSAAVRLKIPTTARSLRVVLRSDESAVLQRVTVERNGWCSLQIPAMTGWVLLPSP